MFGRTNRIPIDIMSSGRANNTKCNTILEYEDKLKQLYKTVRENMQTRQCKVAPFYDRKIKDNILKKGNLVLILLFRNVKHNLSCNWEGTHKISHPTYEIS